MAGDRRGPHAAARTAPRQLDGNADDGKRMLKATWPRNASICNPSHGLESESESKLPGPNMSMPV